MVYAKMAELSEMPFGWLTCLSSRNHVLDWVEIPQERVIFGGCLAHSKALAVSAVMFARKGIIQYSIVLTVKRIIISSIVARRDAPFSQNSLTAYFSLFYAQFLCNN